MARGFDGTAVGAESFEPGSRAIVPGDVQTAFLLWLAAVGAGVVEMIIRVIDPLSVGPGSGAEADVTGMVFGVAIRTTVYAVVVYMIVQMRLGKRWARIALAILPGMVGTLSLVVDPISWLANGNSLREVFTEADLLFIFVAPIRVMHLMAVLAALVFMFRPAANDYFRAAR